MEEDGRKVVPQNAQGTRIGRPEFTKIAQEVWQRSPSRENHLLLKAVFDKREEEILSEPMLSLGANLVYGVFTSKQDSRA